MLVAVSKDYILSTDAVVSISRDEHDKRFFDVKLQGEDEPRCLDTSEANRLIAASAPIIPAHNHVSALYVRYDTWGLPVIVDRPVVAWRVLPEGPQPIIALEPKGEKPNAFLTPHGHVLLPSGEALRPQEWGARLIFDEAARTGRVLDAPPVVVDPLA